MIGGLFKSASRLALVAVAGVMVGGVSAQAADLGGDCCADLEERVAELEATTVRKGTRKVSLTVSGWVHKSIMHWNDGMERNTYAGVDSINGSTRFRFTGDAKITPKWSTGYLLEMEALGDMNSSSVTQTNSGLGSAGANMVVRHSAWWLDNKDLGRVWVGMTDAAGAGIDGINLANTNAAANAKVGLNGGGFFLRGSTGALDANSNVNLSARTWANILHGNSGISNLSDETRNNVVKYVSPTVMGFIFAASWGEDDMWDVSLKYAGEHHGFRFAAGAAYTQVSDANLAAVAGNNHFNGCADTVNFGPAVGMTRGDRDCSSFALAGSLMHVATGLFITGNYGQRTDNARKEAFALGTTIDPALISSKDTNWGVRGGIEKNWTGMGNTTLFGEYNVADGTPLAAGASQSTDAALVAGAAQTIVNSEVTTWGFGVVQSFDAAALDIYLAYRNISADVRSSTAANVTTNITDIKDFQLITLGAIMKF